MPLRKNHRQLIDEATDYKPELGQAPELVLYCQSGWRSALATAALVDMGRDGVAHVDGGFSAWREAGLPTGPRPDRG